MSMVYIYCTHLIVGFALVSTKEARCGFVASCALHRSPVIPLDRELLGAGLVPPADVLVLVCVLVLPEAAVVVAARCCLNTLQPRLLVITADQTVITLLG